MQGNVNETHANHPPNYLNLKYEQYVIESMTWKHRNQKKKIRSKTNYSKTDAEVEENCREDNIHENREKAPLYHNTE